MSEEVTRRTPDPLAEKIRELEEAKRILEDVEVQGTLGCRPGTDRSGRKLVPDGEGVDRHTSERMDDREASRQAPRVRVD